MWGTLCSGHFLKLACNQSCEGSREAGQYLYTYKYCWWKFRGNVKLSYWHSSFRVCSQGKDDFNSWSDQVTSFLVFHVTFASMVTLFREASLESEASGTYKNRRLSRAMTLQLYAHHTSAIKLDFKASLSCNSICAHWLTSLTCIAWWIIVIITPQSHNVLYMYIPPTPRLAPMYHTSRSQRGSHYFRLHLHTCMVVFLWQGIGIFLGRILSSKPGHCMLC